MRLSRRPLLFVSSRYNHRSHRRPHPARLEGLRKPDASWALSTLRARRHTHNMLHRRRRHFLHSRRKLPNSRANLAQNPHSCRNIQRICIHGTSHPKNPPIRLECPGSSWAPHRGSSHRPAHRSLCTPPTASATRRAKAASTSRLGTGPRGPGARRPRRRAAPLARGGLSANDQPTPPRARPPIPAWRWCPAPRSSDRCGVPRTTCLWSRRLP
mmetsp:Transcript_116830/g.302840  ORF Transcript_116830/g.302840 Transcript_116830/m.302840 type:complete len:213 (-) Transcript_116830:900-1538(-)